MQRSVDPSDVIALPPLTMRGVHAMAEGLVAAGGGGVPGGAEASYGRLKARKGELLAAASSRNVALETGESARETDREADHLHQMHRQWLGAFAGLDVPENVVRPVAQRLHQTWYGEGAFYAASRHEEQWAQTEARIAAVDTQGLAGDYETLGGAIFLTAMRRVHATYGQVTGITAPLPEAPEEAALRPLSDALRRAIKEYVFKVGASVEPDDAESAALAARLLRPYTHWDSGKGGKAAASSEALVDPDPTAPTA